MAISLYETTYSKLAYTFGHQTRRWNPKMAPYIFTETKRYLHHRPAKNCKKSLTKLITSSVKLLLTGENILFVGTKKQAQEAIKDEATRCNMFLRKRNVGWAVC